MSIGSLCETCINFGKCPYPHSHEGHIFDKDKCGLYSRGTTSQQFATMHIEAEEQTMAAEQEQVGGDHYRKHKIQPMRFSMENGLDACQHTIIKYVTRFRDKGGIADLEKAKHTIDLLIQFEKEKQK